MTRYQGEEGGDQPQKGALSDADDAAERESLGPGVRGEGSKHLIGKLDDVHIIANVGSLEQFRIRAHIVQVGRGNISHRRNGAPQAPAPACSRTPSNQSPCGAQPRPLALRLIVLGDEQVDCGEAPPGRRSDPAAPRNAARVSKW